MGCPLEVHTAQRALRHCIGRAVLNEIRLEPMLRKFLRTEHPREAAARIPCRGGLDEPGIREDGFNELHRVLRGRFTRDSGHSGTVPVSKLWRILTFTAIQPPYRFRQHLSYSAERILPPEEVPERGNEHARWPARKCEPQETKA